MMFNAVIDTDAINEFATRCHINYVSFLDLCFNPTTNNFSHNHRQNWVHLLLISSHPTIQYAATVAGLSFTTKKLPRLVTASPTALFIYLMVITTLHIHIKSHKMVKQLPSPPSLSTTSLPPL